MELSILPIETYVKNFLEERIQKNEINAYKIEEPVLIVGWELNNRYKKGILEVETRNGRQLVQASFPRKYWGNRLRRVFLKKQIGVLNVDFSIQPITPVDFIRIDLVLPYEGKTS
jgi:hypothetical protein